MDELLKIKNLSIGFPSKQGWHDVVSQINLTIHKSSSLGLVGESGSGKSMTALSIMQLLPFSARISQHSEIWFSGKNLLNCTERQMRDYRGVRIGMIFQDAMSAFNPVLTIAQQMDEVLKKFEKLSTKERREYALNWLDEVGIKQIKRCYQAYPHQLSGGMRQRAMIAMALCCNPELIIADEPTTALDVTIQAQILDLLLALREKQKLTLLYITHNLALVSKIADEVVVMQRGNIMEKKSVRLFFQNPENAYSRKLLAAIPASLPRQTANIQSANLMTVKSLKVYFPIKSQGWLPNKTVVKAVDGIDFAVNEGETLAIVGESGSGKTTVAKAVIRLLKPTAGEIFFNHQDLCQLSTRLLKKYRRDLQIIFQDPYVSLNPRAMIAESIIEGMASQKIITKKTLQLQRVDELLEQVGLSPEIKWRYPHEFSGGEKQRICLARALAVKPKLLILDEPTSALDVSIQMQVLQLLESLQKQYKISYLLITHDLGVVAYLSHYTAVLYQGRIVEQGETRVLLQNPQHAYTQRLLSAIPVIPLDKDHILRPRF